MDEFEV